MTFDYLHPDCMASVFQLSYLWVLCSINSVQEWKISVGGYLQRYTQCSSGFVIQVALRMKDNCCHIMQIDVIYRRKKKASEREREGEKGFKREAEMTGTRP